MTMRSSLRVQLLTLLACVIASPLVAQMATPDPAVAEIAPVVAPPIPDAPVAGPTMASATLGYSSASDASTEMTWNNQQRAKNNSGPVLAIVGGAALIGGLIMGLIGLYLWLK